MPTYTASCHCGAIRYEATQEPVDAKICHCTTCQTIHGAPMQWAVIFHKDAIRFVAGEESLVYYNSDSKQKEHTLPCKVSCPDCGTLIADEGRRMWLVFPSLFQFDDDEVPESFKPSCHIFYGQRIVDIDDGLPKWSGHKDKSDRLGWPS